MRTNQIYVGIKGQVLALDSVTGDVLWKADLAGSSYVTVVDDGPRVYALAQGEAYCLDAQTGSILWHNPTRIPIRSSQVPLAACSALTIRATPGSNFRRKVSRV